MPKPAPVHPAQPPPAVRAAPVAAVAGSSAVAVAGSGGKMFDALTARPRDKINTEDMVAAEKHARCACMYTCMRCVIVHAAVPESRESWQRDTHVFLRHLFGNSLLISTDTC
jgi:hypothetical protein